MTAVTDTTPLALAEALEARAPYYSEWAADIRRLNGLSVDADHSDKTAALLRAAAAKLREMDAALKPFAETAEHDIVIDQPDSFGFIPLPATFCYAAPTIVGHFRAARRARSGA